MPPSSAHPDTDSIAPDRSRRLRWSQAVVLTLAVTAVAVHHGLPSPSVGQSLVWGACSLTAMVFLVISDGLLYAWSLRRITMLRTNPGRIAVDLIWIPGVLLLLAGVPGLRGGQSPVVQNLIDWSELTVLARGFLGAVRLTRLVAGARRNPAVVLVGSFVLLIAVGTLLLMLPRARAPLPDGRLNSSAPISVALFTATSAGCVTGLVVESTGTYWSRFGQTVILGLFQIGGLGIMTCGALFAVATGGSMQFGESATLGELLESEGPREVRRLLLSILALTIGAEAVGAILMSGLWSESEPSEQLFLSVFHSVSAFCNAGFAISDRSFEGMASRWQVWGVLSGLIILGGMGFAVLSNVGTTVLSHLRRWRRRSLAGNHRPPRRLSVMSKLAVLTTAVLIVLGALGYFLLESTGTATSAGRSHPLADAWFQSVTFRTAGFNTVDHGTLQPATRLFAIMLMFIGASPGSTGGGVKTVCFAVTMLSVVSVLRGRDRVEIFGRTIPSVQVNHALAIMAIAMLILMTSTLFLVLFEHRPERFIDHLFEATSAFGTVGVSTGITADLSPASRVVVIVTMFLGRVGPLTILLALAGQTRRARYDYPYERVTLG